jgi:hypothetical protein
LNGLFESTYHSDPNVRMQAELALRDVSLDFLYLADWSSVREAAQLLLGPARAYLRSSGPYPSQASRVHLL